MTIAHTPGPWHQDSHHETYIRAHGDVRGTCAVARICRRGGWSEQEGNRKLIQAAPDLLRALQNLVDADWNTEAGYEAAKAARVVIAKVTT